MNDTTDNAKKGIVANILEICYPKIQDPVSQIYDDTDFKEVIFKQFKDRTILAVTYDISLALKNQVLSVLPGDEVVYDAVDKIISDDPQD